MRVATSLFELLAETGGAEMVLHRDGATLAVSVLGFPNGRRMLALERTYRQGICVILDPTPEEIEIARSGDLWQLWNSDRVSLLASVV